MDRLCECIVVFRMWRALDRHGCVETGGLGLGSSHTGHIFSTVHGCADTVGVDLLPAVNRSLILCLQ